MVQKLVVAVNVQSSTVTLLASIARVAEPKFIPLRPVRENNESSELLVI